MRSVDRLLLILNFVFSVGGEDSARSQARCSCSCRPDVAGRGHHAQVTGGAGNERPPAHVRRGVRFRRAGEEFEGKGAEGSSASCGGIEAKET